MLWASADDHDVVTGTETSTKPAPLPSPRSSTCPPWKMDERDYPRSLFLFKHHPVGLSDFLYQLQGLGWHQGAVSHAVVDMLRLKAHFGFITEGFSKISSFALLGF